MPRAVSIVGAACVLHNMCLLFDDEWEQQDDAEYAGEEDAVAPANDHVR